MSLGDDDEKNANFAFAYIIKPKESEYVGCKSFRDMEIVGIEFDYTLTVKMEQH